MVDQAEQQPQFHVNTQSVSIQPLAEFSPEAEICSSLAAKWKLWMEDFEMFILASGITDPKRKRALLLYQAGQRVLEIFCQLQDTGTETDYDTAKTKLQEYFEPRKIGAMRYISSARRNKNHKKLLTSFTRDSDH